MDRHRQTWSWIGNIAMVGKDHHHQQPNFEVRQNSVRVNGENKFARGFQSGASQETLPIDHLGFLSHSANAIAIANLIIIVIAVTMAI